MQILECKKLGKSFSIIAIAEEAISRDFIEVYSKLQQKIDATPDESSRERLKTERNELDVLNASRRLGTCCGDK